MRASAVLRIAYDPLPDPGVPTLSRRVHSLLAAVLLGLALAFAQATAIAHAIGHLDDAPTPVGLHSQLCGQCATSATVLAGGGVASAPAVVHVAAVVAVVAATVSLVVWPPPRAFRSRAPPLMS